MKKGIRVFIVEDALFLREVLCRIFMEAGIEVVGSARAGGDETLSHIKNLNPDVVLVDLVLPGENGMTLLSQLSDTSPHVKLIVCSSLRNELFKVQSEMAGAMEFIHKPFDSDEIVKIVSSVGAAGGAAESQVA